jgi:hypothetical protein
MAGDGDQEDEELLEAVAVFAKGFDAPAAEGGGAGEGGVAEAGQKEGGSQQQDPPHI